MMLSLNRYNLIPYLIVFFIVTLFFMLASIHPYGITNDVAFQIKSVQQFLRHDSNLLNSITLPSPKDLSKDLQTWIVWWPLGIPVFFMPLIAMGLSLGFATRLTAYILFLLGCIGWIKVADKVKASFATKIILSLVLPVYSLTIASVTVLKGEVLPFGIMPWLFLYTLYISSIMDSGRKKYNQVIIHSCFLGLMLGLTYWLKYSALLASCGLLLYILLYILFFNHEYSLYRRFILLGIFIFCSLFPIIIFTVLNQYLAGINNSLSQIREFNLYYKVAGIKGLELICFLLGAPGLALFQAEGWLMHIIFFTDIIFPPSVPMLSNPRVVLLTIAGMPITVVTIWLFLYSRKIFNKVIFIFGCCITFIPFILLAYFTKISGFNFLIHGNNRYVSSFFIFTEILLISSFCHLASNTKRIIIKVLTFIILFALFLLPNIFHIVNFIKNGLWERINYSYITTENNIFVPALSQKNVKSVIDKIDSLVKSPRDIVVLNVLDDGSTSFASWLEIKQRLLPLSHFWVPLAHTYGSIIDPGSSEVFLSSEKLRVILVISKSTEKDSKNLSKIKQRFPQAKTWFRLPDTVDLYSLVSLWYADLGVS